MILKIKNESTIANKAFFEVDYSFLFQNRLLKIDDFL